MIFVQNVQNVNTALYNGLHLLEKYGVKEMSRNGPVLVLPEPIITVTSHPCERVLFHPARDANPFFHLMESLWMLGGANNVGFPAYFNAGFSRFAESDGKVWGAYGFRWRKHFAFDQLRYIYKMLHNDAGSRQAVLQMWDCQTDLNPDADDRPKDIPCNTHIYFDLRGSKLNMTVCCRSNDAIWGAHGANAVHMTILQEYMASWLGFPVGVYRQMSNNYHRYTDMEGYPKLKSEELNLDVFYGRDLHPKPLVSGTGPDAINDFNRDLEVFFEKVGGNTSDKFLQPFFSGVAWPMFSAWRTRKERTGTGLEDARQITAPDWRKACVEWIERRMK